MILGSSHVELASHLNPSLSPGWVASWLPGVTVGLSVRVATALAAGSYAYAGMWPESQLFGPCVVASKHPGEIALTYDDGPADPDTFNLLEVLAKHGVRATFFMIGQFVRQRPDIVRAVAAAGHLIGNHTFTHPLLLIRRPSIVLQELRDCNAALEDVLGAPVHWFRPPHGSRRPDILRSARELGLKTVMWNAMGFDWKPTTPEAVQQNVLRGFRKNQRRDHATNVLLHDGGQAEHTQDRNHTVLATDRLIPYWKEYFSQRGQTCEFVTPAAWA